MSHKIITFSTLHQNGLTAFGLLTSQALTYSNMRSLYTFAQPNSMAPSFINVKTLDDPTRSIMQFVKLLELGALKTSEILDYAIPYAKNAYIMGISDKTLTERSQKKVAQYVFRSVPTDVVICDDSSDSVNELSKSLIDSADQIFFVITPNRKNYLQLHEWMRLPQFYGRKDIYVVINYYDEEIGAIRDISKQIGIPVSHICKIHYNPYITRCMLRGELQQIVPYIHAKDPRVLNLINDMDTIVRCVKSAMISKERR